jgi:hypothetical protein
MTPTNSRKAGGAAPARKRGRPPRRHVVQSPDAFAFTLRNFQLLGGPGKTKVYELGKTLDAAGKPVLELFKDAIGRTLITGKSARSYLGVKDEATT